MKDIVFFVIAGAVAALTFALIARKYGANCLP